MTISERDRRLLWGRSGNRCAICKLELVNERTTEDRESIVGDEAHIAARSQGGSRYGECEPGQVDSYDNLILLCKVDHKTVDDQPTEYTTGKLHRIKADHEEWVRERLDNDDGVEPIRVVPDPAAPPVVNLALLQTGSEVWNLVSDAHAYRFGDLDETSSDEDLDVTAEFFQLAQDWGNISGEVEAQGMTGIRDAKRSLNESLEALRTRGLLVFGGQRRLIVRGGVRTPASWNEAVIRVVRADDPQIIKLSTEAPQESPNSRRRSSPSEPAAS